ncbi:hypothetical protein [Microbacterium testaceum]|uniref:hypothetical protein n=1 Tax=Microbacterium testaceum TaxID=2033 RepID=UPI0025B11DF3|nr:hypothetical protein [Microbacterium testaceum]WJS89745.1 hypothetical protein NYQ11_10370 [Microbacterium testaceum]
MRRLIVLAIEVPPVGAERLLLGDVVAEQIQEFVGCRDIALGAVLGRAQIDEPAGLSLHLSPHADLAVQEVDIEKLHRRGLAQVQPSERAERDEGSEPILIGVHDRRDLFLRGDAHHHVGLPHVGECHPSEGSVAISRSRTAAWSAAPTLLTRV